MKKIRFNQVKELTKKINQKEFEDLFYFSHRFSNFFTYFFINFGITPNQVTVIFFLTGLLSCILLFSSNIYLIIMGFILWRLHIILDLCDGEVARYTKNFSFNGAYWDYLIHSLLYPLCFIGISFSLFISFNNYLFLILSAAGSITLSIQLAIKNTYYRALYVNKVSDEVSTKIYKRNKIKKVILELISFDYFLFTYIIFRLLDFNESIFLFLLLIYLVLFNIFSATKFFILSSKNK